MGRPTKFDPEAPTLIVHETQYKAERAILALNIHAWPIGVGGALGGRRFDKILILCDLSRMIQGAEYLKLLQTKMPPNGRLIDIS